ncbi:hypothetical protein D9M69_635470 [compost metagenome]
MMVVPLGGTARPIAGVMKMPSCPAIPLSILCGPNGLAGSGCPSREMVITSKPYLCFSPVSAATAWLQRVQSAPLKNSTSTACFEIVLSRCSFCLPAAVARASAAAFEAG